MGPIGLGATIAGSLFTGLAAKNSANATAGMYGYQSAISQINQKLQLQNRDWALQAGGQEAVRYGMKARSEAGMIRAAQGASGISLDSDSSVAVRESKDLISRMDLETITTNTARKAYGFEVAAEEAGLQSDMYTRAASDAKRGGDLAMMGSIISGVGSVASKWSEAKTTGLFNS